MVTKPLTAAPPLAVTARATSVAAIAIGVLVLVGWWFDNATLKSIVPGLSTMKANTALGLILSGTSLWLLQTGQSTTHRVASQSLACVVVIMASLTLFEYVTGRTVGIDQFVVADVAHVPATAPPGRMGVSTALCFVLEGVALLLSLGARKGVREISQVLALFGAGIAGVAIIGYAYSVDSLSGLGSYTQMAIHTAVLLLALGLGVASVHRREGIIGIITSPGSGGTLARHLLPAVLLGPFLIGWIRLEGQQAGLYGTELGIAMFATANAVIFGVVVLLYAARVDHLDRAKRTAEGDLREADERTGFALAAARMGVWEVDFRTGGLKWSDTMASVFGLPLERAPRTTEAFFELVHPDDRRDVEASIARAIAGESNYAVEFRATWPDGTTHWIYGRAQGLYDAEGKLVRLLGVGLDIGERKSLEAQLRQSQKLEAIGQLAGGVAHDFNNVLTAIIGYSDLLLADMVGDARVRADLEEIRKAGARASAITQQLLAFSRKQILQPRVLDVNLLVSEMESMLKRLVFEHVQIATHLDAQVGKVKSDPTQLEQILVNLAVNARDAMPSGGRLTIETANATLDASYQQQHAPVVAGEYVLLSVSDTGAGMDADTQQRIFEPFFTTKAQGKGTGLGLATVYGIVKQSGGYVWVYSELGRGTTFKIYLPRVYESLAALIDPKDIPGEQKRGTETILVVEDEPGVRLLARRVLERYGYQVLEASHPAEAVGVARQHAQRIDLLLSDVVMPGSGPVSLVDQLASEQPGMRVLYMSGYAAGAVHHGLLLEGTPFLQKPFTAQTLAEKVREVLDL